MHIVADENIPFAREAFSTIGDITLVHGRSMPSLKGVDALIVRSITKVNETLLARSDVRFVGTATIGVDHIDTAFLDREGIGFASAPGSNANSVAEYVTAALLVYADQHGIELAGKTIGVIGVGNVGSRVVDKCTCLGMTALENDPPRRDATGDPRFLPLDDALRADFVTLHVPLTSSGPYPTRHMMDDDTLGAVSGVLLNTSRGSVVDENALMRALDGSLRDVILDVWEHEPDVTSELAARTAGGTPHIAGYSYDGKVNGTQMMYDAVCGHFGIEGVWRAADVMPPGKSITCSGETIEDIIRDAVLQVYDIRDDYRRFREGLHEFDRLRKGYPRRREFPTTEVNGIADDRARKALDCLGFRVSE